jgi:hypothetical protein
MSPSASLHRCVTSLCELLRDRRGTSLIEFGVAAPVLLIFLIGISDLGRGLSERYRLQQVVNRSLEMVQASSALGFSDLEAQAEAAAGAGSDATVEQWLECGGSTRNWDDACPSGEPARYVKMTLTRGFSPLFGNVGYPNVQPDGTVRLTVHATLRVG